MDALSASSSLTNDQVYSENRLKLVRYRQVLNEIVALEEALTTYEKVIRQFTSSELRCNNLQVNLNGRLRDYEKTQDLQEGRITFFGKVI